MKKNKKQEQLREEFGKFAGSSKRAVMTRSMIEEYWNWIEKALDQKEAEVLELVEESRGDDYHNIGIGSLDYNEKSAVDAYIETLKHRLTKLKKTMSKTKTSEELKKEIKPTCEHLDWDNKRDCENEAEYMCMCCGSPTCQEHKEKECPHGGMGYIEL